MMDDNNKLIFKKENYIIMAAGILVLILGFWLMSIEDAEYGFGFLGLTLGPMIVLLGFIIQFFAILYKPRRKE